MNNRHRLYSQLKILLSTIKIFFFLHQVIDQTYFDFIRNFTLIPGKNNIVGNGLLLAVYFLLQENTFLICNVPSGI